MKMMFKNVESGSRQTSTHKEQNHHVMTEPEEKNKVRLGRAKRNDNKQKTAKHLRSARQRLIRRKIRRARIVKRYFFRLLSHFNFKAQHWGY